LAGQRYRNEGKEALLQETRVEIFRKHIVKVQYLGTTVENPNNIYEEVQSILNSGNDG
jgi:RNA-binding protein YhbY